MDGKFRTFFDRKHRLPLSDQLQRRPDRHWRRGRRHSGKPSYAVDTNGQNIDPNLPASQQSSARWFNTSAFVQPVYAFGNVGRNTNVANHSNYKPIGRIINYPTFGIVQNQISPRQIQFAVKVGF